MNGVYNRLFSGKADIIFVVGLSDQLQQMAKDNNAELKATPIGYETLVFYVNAINPISDLSVNDNRLLAQLIEQVEITKACD